MEFLIEPSVSSCNKISAMKTCSWFELLRIRVTGEVVPKKERKSDLLSTANSPAETPARPAIATSFVVPLFWTVREGGGAPHDALSGTIPASRKVIPVDHDSLVLHS